MKVVKNGENPRRIKAPIVTLGNFDGLHLGHQRILERVSTRARECGSHCVVFTFEPHPQKVVSPRTSPLLLLDLPEKVRLLESFGIDYLVLARFTKRFASKHPREFVEETIVGWLGAKEVWVGHDFSFGSGKCGTVEHLKEFGREFGFKVTVVAACKKGGEVISSSRVRRLILEGEVGGGAKLLGRPYAVKGRVVKGAGLGKTIGFPTANIEVTSELIPGRGVYAAFITIDKTRRPGVVNIGTAPTVGRKKTVIEAHIPDVSRSLYNRRMTIEFVKRLRDETKFRDTGELTRQIAKDVTRARRVLRG